jgi:Chitin synthesis regulation, resistance to Congo red
LTHRHRRRQGLQPYKGTRWISKTLFGHSLAANDAQTQQQQQPQYGTDTQAVSSPSYQQTGEYYGHNQGYFKGQEIGTEPQQPPNAYRGGGDVYQPQNDRYPKEDDGIVR